MMSRGSIRWRPDAPGRRNGELPPPARLWLSARLGVTPNAKLLGVADQETWEDLTAQDAQRHLRAGNPAAALDVLRRRKKRAPASPLFRIGNRGRHPNP